MWIDEFRAPVVWGERDCVSFVAAWLQAHHGVTRPRPEGLTEALQSRPAEELLRVWHTHLTKNGFRVHGNEILLLEKRGLLHVGVLIDSHWMMYTARGVRPARGKICAHYRYVGET